MVILDIITFIVGYSFIGIITWVIISCVYAKWWVTGKDPKTKQGVIIRNLIWLVLGVICGPFVWLLIFEQVKKENNKKGN